VNRLLHPRFVVLCALAGVAIAAGAAHGKPPCENATTTILIVRHADRAGQADSLTEAGVARARELARVAKNAGVRAIYHSDTRRTRNTAAPLADELKLELEEYPAKQVADLIERILHDHVGETVLVVGHSNTVPMIVFAAGGPMIPDINDNEFDGLFVLTMRCVDGKSTLTRLEYGAPSP
jgi:broad specificity phosphatase PhoE